MLAGLSCWDKIQECCLWCLISRKHLKSRERQVFWLVSSALPSRLVAVAFGMHRVVAKLTATGIVADSHRCSLFIPCIGRRNGHLYPFANIRISEREISSLPEYFSQRAQIIFEHQHKDSERYEKNKNWTCWNSVVSRIIPQWGWPKSIKGSPSLYWGLNKKSYF